MDRTGTKFGIFCVNLFILAAPFVREQGYARRRTLVACPFSFSVVAEPTEDIRLVLVTASSSFELLAPLSAGILICAVPATLHFSAKRRVDIDNFNELSIDDLNSICRAMPSFRVPI